MVSCQDGNWLVSEKLGKMYVLNANVTGPYLPCEITYLNSEAQLGKLFEMELHIEPQQTNLAKGEKSAVHETKPFYCGTLKHTTKQEHLRDRHTLLCTCTETNPYMHRHSHRPCPKAFESHHYCRSPPMALESGMACHLELGGGFVRGVLKPSGTCFDRAANHLAWHTVYQ